MTEIESRPDSVYSRRLRLGGIALISAGVTLAPQGPLTSNVPSAPEQNLEFATGANSFGFRFGMVLAYLAIAFLVLGVFALYVRLSSTSQERLAVVGLIMTVGFLVLFLPITGFAAFVVPAIGELVARGRPEMLEVMDQTFREPFVAIPFLSGILWNVGMILLGIAVWRSHTLWKWGGLLLVASGVIGIPGFLDVKAFQIVGTLISGVALIVVGVDLRRPLASTVR